MSSLTISTTGDVLLHGNLLKKAMKEGKYDFFPMLEETKKIFSCDINVVNQESVVAGVEHGISSYPAFNSPIEILETLKSYGVNWANVANNHMLDKGEAGLAAALKNLDSLGIQYIGASLKKGNRVSYAEQNGVKVGFVSYTDGSKINLEKIKDLQINFFKGESYAMRMNRRLSSVKQDIKEAKKNSDFVVLFIHFGEEYFRFPSSFQKDIINSLVETGVGAIIGHHPHVLQPIDWVENSRGKQVLVAYSLGNFFSGQAGLYRQIGGCLKFSITKQKSSSCVIDSLTFTPTFVDLYNGYKLKSLKELARKGLILKTGMSDSFSAVEIYDRLRTHMNFQSLSNHERVRFIYE